MTIKGMDGKLAEHHHCITLTKCNVSNE